MPLSVSCAQISVRCFTVCTFLFVYFLYDSIINKNVEFTDNADSNAGLDGLTVTVIAEKCQQSVSAEATARLAQVVTSDRHRDSTASLSTFHDKSRLNRQFQENFGKIKEVAYLLYRYHWKTGSSWGTGIRGPMRAMAKLPQSNQKLLVVKDKVGRPQVSLALASRWNAIFSLQYFISVDCRNCHQAV